MLSGRRKPALGRGGTSAQQISLGTSGVVALSARRQEILSDRLGGFVRDQTCRDCPRPVTIHERDKVGRLRTQDKSLIDQAMQGDTASARVSTPFSAASTGNDQTPTNLLEVFVPLHVPDRIAVAGVAEVDYYYDNLVRAAHDQWFKFIVFFAVAAALCLIMTIRSFRTPVKTLGADVGGSAGQAPDQPADEAVKAVLQEADLAGVRAQLQQMQTDLVSATAINEDSTHVTELQESLTRAEAQIAAMAPDHPAIDDPVLAQIEERIVSAEQRAEDAEASLKKLRKTPAAVAEGPTAAETDAAADDLRTRLARTASRKKLGGDDGSPAPTRPA